MEPDSDRLRRIEALDPLIEALSRALDIREVFKQLAAVSKVAIEHDYLGLGRFDEELKTARIYALSLDEQLEPTVCQISPSTRANLERGFGIIDDMRDHPDPEKFEVQLRTPERGEQVWIPSDVDREMKRLYLTLGTRSILYIAVRVQGQIAGGLFFHSSRPSAFSLDDLRVAGRIAELVALALSHERLAEEARVAAEERARAERLEAQVLRLTNELAATGSHHRQIGISRKWKHVIAQATKVSATEASVLITGESGTGKEVVARYIHRSSPRRDRPFVAINCAALPEQLLESELFGHEKGAFTGAISAHPGRIEQAGGGVLFLDEVGEMSPAVQAKFLRVVQEREYQRLGSTALRKADLRIIAATNRNLEAAMQRGDFREDLYYRLQVFELHLPPLRDRPEDVMALALHFIDEICAAVGRPAAGISEDAKQRVLGYHWPGNARELRNAIERAVILSDGGLICGEHLPFTAQSRIPNSSPTPLTQLPPAGVDLELIERTLIEQALERTGNNKSRAARLLHLTRAQLYTRLERYGLG
jgi:transcriptional regulator with GAF, ATPase, and Fis domain